MKLPYHAPLAAVLSAATLTSAALAREYQVKHGDTLSQIAQRELGSPVYTKSGSLQRLLELNPSVGNPDVITPGQVLLLAPAESAIEVAAETEKAASEEAAKPVEAVAQANASAANQGGSSEVSQWTLGVEAIVADTSVKARDKGNFDTALRSNINTGMRLSLAYMPSEDWRFTVFGQLVNSAFDSTKDNRFQEVDKVLKRFGGKAEVIFGRVSVGGSYGVEERYFLTQKSADVLTFSPVYVDRAALELRADLVKWDGGLMGLAAQGTYLGKGSGDGFDVKAGQAYGGEILAAQSLTDALDLTAAFYAEKGEQDSSVAEQKQTDAGLRAGIAAKF